MEMSKISIRNLDLYYSDFKALKNVNLEIEANKITAFIGPSGCGKSTLLKSINRMNDLVEGCRIEGTIELDGQNIFKGMDVNMLRKRVGMVFQKPNPFPMSIYDNIAYGPRTHGVHSKAKLDDIVEKSLRNAAIWDECKDRLKSSALGMSGGQQQRLCIARALAVEPEVLLMDEPTSALDPISTSKIEDLAMELKKDYTIVMVTHNMQQAVRVSDNTAFPGPNPALKATNIVRAVFIVHSSRAFLLSIHPLPRIDISFRIIVRSETMRRIILPISLILHLSVLTQLLSLP